MKMKGSLPVSFVNLFAISSAAVPAQRAASVFVLLNQQLRQYLYFCTSCVSICTFLLAAVPTASVFVLFYQQLRQYSYFFTSSCVSICTFAPAAASVFVFCTSSCVSIY
jgi:hypothetical protein